MFSGENRRFSAGILSVLALMGLSVLPVVHAAELEPRYWWTPNTLPNTRYGSAEEAFLAYKAWQEAADPDTTVIGYEPILVYRTLNGLYRAFGFRYVHPTNCPNSCIGNFMEMPAECPTGTSAQTVVLSSTAEALYCVEPSTKREPDFKDCPIGNPIYPTTGMKREVAVDYEDGKGELRFVRTYRSDRNGWRSNYDIAAVDVSSALGTPSVPSGACRPGLGRTTSQPYCFRYISRGAPNDFIIKRSDGQLRYFDSATGVASSADVTDRVSRVTDSSGMLIGWNLYDSVEDSVNRFDIGGRLQSITSRNGRVQTLTYSDSTTAAAIAPFAGLLIRVRDHDGKQLSFTYDGQGRMHTMTDPAGGVYTYGYDGPSSIVSPGQVVVGNLTSVTYSDQSQRVYWYNEQDKTANANLPFALTGITDESGQRYATFAYDSSGRGVSTEHAGGAQKYTFGYGSNQTTVNDPLGTARTYNHSALLGTSKVTSVSAPCTSGCSADASTTYDANGNAASRTDFRGNKTCYAYDLTRNLESVRIEGLASGVSCPAVPSTYTPTPGTHQRKITTQWHPTYRTPAQVDEAGRRTIYTHDTSGNVLTRTRIDLTSTPNISRTWDYTYNSHGRVLTADGPRTDVSDVTTFTYYNCTTGDQCGQVHTITNAAGHVTTYNTYNSHGQPLTITDSNGVVTALTYDLRQRVTSRTIGTEITTFEYWPTGLLKKVTLPDTSYLNYIYDNAHRLTEIQDSESNRIVYTLDAMGNRTAEQTFDPSSALTQTRSRVFDTLNRLQKEIGAAGTVNVTTTFGYDNNGNQTSIAAPLGRNTGQTYDELNRLTQVSGPLSTVTQYGYNALDQLISVTDPRSKVTSYTYNALGDLTQQVSPDTGTTINTYDSAGNLLTSTDARNKISTYAYDALSRVTSLSYLDQAIGYTYDGGSNQNGRLTQVTDASGSTSWTYDPQGRVLSRQQNMGITKNVGYAYDLSGRLETLTLPSGNAITYGYTDGKVTSLTLNGSTTILSDVLYQPFGPTRGWTWGNSTQAIREYDTDGLVTDIDSAGLKTYGYDNAFRITGITDASDATLSQSYGYDLLDRLTSATATSLNQSWTYDANGNRLTQGGSSASTYTVSTTSNRLNSVSGTLSRSYIYDNAGNTTNDGSATFLYNDAGRMVSATKAGTTTTYALNALGQRVKKTTSGTSRYFVYDESGHLLGEYNNSGVLIQETIWLGDTPVATLRPNGGGVSVFHVHTDHLNTPRRITRPSDNVVVWRWDSDPFGTTAANEDPDGDSTLFVYGLRFPGQYFDQETGLNYNYFRDYDPQTGRYVESDPIGLEGGQNTYLYANANALKFVDPRGLGPYEGAAPPPGIPGGPWNWFPDPGNSRGGAYRDPGGQSASWDPSGHWDVDDGKGGPRKRYDRWGNATVNHRPRNPKAPDQKPILKWGKKACKVLGPLGILGTIGIGLTNDEEINPGDLACDAMWGCNDAL